MTPRAPLTKVFVAAVLVSLAAGCISTKPKKKSELMRSSQRVTYAYTAEELRLLMRDAVGPITGRIEETADRIIAEADDPAIRRAALLWKLEATPAYREALFRADPVAAVLDSLGLTLQMKAYFAEGPGRDALGDWHTLAVDTSRELEQDHLEFIDRIVASGDPTNAIELIRTWAADNPIRHTIASRPSIMNMVGTIKNRSGTGGLVSGIGVTVDDMVRRVEVYSDQLPRQARWQAELMLMDATGGLELDGTLAELPALIATLQDVAETVAEVEAMVTRQRDYMLSDVERQRLETLEFTAARLEEVLAFVQNERGVVVGEVERQRLATLEDVRAELRFLVETVATERATVLAEAEAITDRRIDVALDRVEGMVDRILLKVALLLGVCLIIGSVVALVAVRLARRSA